MQQVRQVPIFGTYENKSNSLMNKQFIILKSLQNLRFRKVRHLCIFLRCFSLNGNIDRTFPLGYLNLRFVDALYKATTAFLRSALFLLA